MGKQGKLVYALMGLSAAAYLLSLALPAIVYHQDLFITRYVRPGISFVDYGMDVLKQGMSGFFLGNFAWYANGVYLAAFGFALAGTSAVSGTLSFVAFAIGLDSLAFSRKPLDESGLNYLNVSHLGPAFYVWEASFLLLCASQVLAFRRGKA